jgi:hypothetical protein
VAKRNILDDARIAEAPSATTDERALAAHRLAVFTRRADRVTRELRLSCGADTRDGFLVTLIRQRLGLEKRS